MANMKSIGSNGLRTIASGSLVDRVADWREATIAVDTAFNRVRAEQGAAFDEAAVYTDTRYMEARFYADALAAGLEQDILSSAGKSAYDLWLEAGNTGTALDFLNSLKSTIPGPPGVSPEVPVGAGTLVPHATDAGLYVPGLGAELVWSETAGRRATARNQITGLQQTIYADTGWRSLTVSSGTLQVRRVGQTVSLNLVNYRPTATGANVITQLPAGFRDTPTTEIFWADENGAPRSAQVRGYSPFELVILGITTINSFVSGSTTFFTVDPWPATLPGTAVGTIPA